MSTCEKNITKHQAASSKGSSLYCFCKSQLFKTFGKAYSMNFTDVGVNKTLCKDPIKAYVGYTAAVYGPTILLTILTMVAAEVAFATSDAEKHYTVDELSESKFLKSALLKYVNLCIIILILNFSDIMKTDFFFT